MAEKKVILEMTTSEEAALAEVLAWVCERHLADKLPNRLASHAAQIGKLNAALNAAR